MSGDEATVESMSRLLQLGPADLLTADALFAVWTVLFLDGVPRLSTLLSGSESFTQSAFVALWLVSGLFLCVANSVFAVRRATTRATA
ncbi:hypothetical protein [Halomarina oriensis]|uniref:Uncharacterized protein n=1 Tax=Halomarina oriensis TaxID=671145 RepID=A0A6B0GQG7_9EURY|nr:hypothetical protein [Halomarina oriensis]MWG33908.1 hypothetical protein [Halomarina oriensis]